MLPLSADREASSGGGAPPYVRQWVLSVPFPLRFLFASRPELLGGVLGIVYRCIATHLTKKAGFSRNTAQTGAVTFSMAPTNPGG